MGLPANLRRNIGAPIWVECPSSISFQPETWHQSNFRNESRGRVHELNLDDNTDIVWSDHGLTYTGPRQLRGDYFPLHSEIAWPARTWRDVRRAILSWGGEQQEQVHL